MLGNEKKSRQRRDQFRAEDRARTGHPDLGKVVLYQMSYFRNNRLKVNIVQWFNGYIVEFEYTFQLINLSTIKPLNRQRTVPFFWDGKNTGCITTTKIYLYLGLYNVFSGTFTSGLPL